MLQSFIIMILSEVFLVNNDYNIPFWVFAF